MVPDSYVEIVPGTSRENRCARDCGQRAESQHSRQNVATRPTDREVKWNLEVKSGHRTDDKMQQEEGCYKTGEWIPQHWDPAA